MELSPKLRDDKIRAVKATLRLLVNKLNDASFHGLDVQIDLTKEEWHVVGDSFSRTQWSAVMRASEQIEVYSCS